VAYFLDPFDPSLASESQVERLRREVFVVSFRDFPRQQEVLLVRSALAARAYLREQGISPQVAANVLENALTPAFDILLRDDYEREAWSAIKERLLRAVFGDSSPARPTERQIRPPSSHTIPCV
jgi:hypothetical protein